jgi:hypothetical protein
MPVLYALFARCSRQLKLKHKQGSVKKHCAAQMLNPVGKRDVVMVTKCANPSCSASFQYLRGGKLFLLDLPRLSSQPGRNGRTAEYFWLCDRCCSELTVTVDASGQAAIAKARAAGRV